jgi:hypothetical protein
LIKEPSLNITSFCNFTWCVAFFVVNKLLLLLSIESEEGMVFFLVVVMEYSNGEKGNVLRTWVLNTKFELKNFYGLLYHIVTLIENIGFSVKLPRFSHFFNNLPIVAMQAITFHLM